MNDGSRRIDDFLKYLRDIALQNSNFHFNHSMIYHELVKLGVPEHQKSKRIDKFFSNWILYFQNDRNCDVFVDDDWNYFCQFISKDDLASSSKEHLKIYVPLDKGHIERGAKEIFEFLSSNKISHISKIGSDVRFDDIVIRLVNPNDVIKLTNFINNNKYIQEGLLPPNPFLYNFKGIPMAVDGELSFNSTVATLIKIYLNNKIDNNDLNTVGVEDFYQFVQYYYIGSFSNEQGLKKLSRDFTNNEYCDNLKLVNYKNVLELLLKFRNDNFNLEDYFEHYNECTDKLVMNVKENQIKNLKMQSTNKIYNDSLEKSVILMIKDIIDTMGQKYGTNYSFDTLIEYVKTGYSNYLTRTNGLRDRVVNSNFRSDLVYILREKEMNIEEYLNNIINPRKSSEEKDINHANDEAIILMVNEILDIMSEKYGEKIAKGNLIDYINTGDNSYLTRSNNLRDRVVKSNFRANLIKMLNERGLDIVEYLNSIIAKKKHIR